LAVFPLDLAADQSDFNDMHQAHGLDAVRDCVLSAIADHELAALTAQDDAPNDAQDAPDGAKRPANAPGKTKPPARKKKPSSGAGAGAAGGDGGHGGDDDHTGGKAANEWDGFSVTDDGVFYAGKDKDGERTKPEWLCSRLDVLALTRDQDSGGWGYHLRFADPLGRVKSWPMPARMLAGDGGEYRAHLMGQGLRIGTSPRARNLLTQYIQTRQPEDFTICTDRTGWHGPAYVLPAETIGDDDERILFQSDQAIENTFRVKGTADQWRENVGALCVGNSRLAFSVACAFAGPLLEHAGVESGGFHLRGDGSTGKSTAQSMAASVYGGADYKQSWRATDNAIEGMAAQHNHCLLVLDEIGEIDPRVIGQTAYMLGNGQGKARSTRSGSPRPRLKWRLLFLSSGEKTLAQFMAEAGHQIKAGQETRMADIPADAGAGFGVFECLHGHSIGSAFADQISEAVKPFHGAPGIEWLRLLTKHSASLPSTLGKRIADMCSLMIPQSANGQVQRVGRRFALVAVAGEMATAAGLTGWPKGESERAAVTCFNAFVNARGGAGNSEVTAMLRKVRAFLESHGEGRFTWWHRGQDDHSPKTLHRAGFRRMVTEDGKPIKTDADHQREYGEKISPTMAESVSVEYFILPEVFKGEVCMGFDHAAVARVLLDHGCLIQSERGRYDTSFKAPTHKGRAYRISPAIFDLDL
jgi:putative DNA primase/helicase